MIRKAFGGIAWPQSREMCGRQFDLGLMYKQGLGVPQDYALAHMWANLAASQGGEDAVKKRDAIASFMTPAQLAEAQRLAREWKAEGE